MTTFALVHGAWQGAWCWKLVAEHLRALGHAVVAVDLPCDDPAAGAAEYAELVVEALANVDGEIVLVAHSFGGLTVPVVAQRLAEQGRPPSRMVFISGLLPWPGRSFDDSSREDADRLMPGLGAGQVGHDDGSSHWQPHAAIATMFPDAPPKVAEWAAGQLRRQHWRVTQEVTPLKSWPEGKVTVIACGGDAVVNADWVRRYARMRFGREAQLLPGDHSPFLSRPEQLAGLLLA